MKIKELRILNNMSQDELAKALKINRTTLSKYENGKIKPPYSVILMFANYFNVTIEELTGIKRDNDDLAIQLNTLISQLDKSTTFNGQELDNDSKELLRQSIMNTVKLCNYLTKE